MNNNNKCSETKWEKFKFFEKWLNLLKKKKKKKKWKARRWRMQVKGHVRFHESAIKRTTTFFLIVQSFCRENPPLTTKKEIEFFKRDCCCCCCCCGRRTRSTGRKQLMTQTNKLHTIFFRLNFLFVVVVVHLHWRENQIKKEKKKKEKWKNIGRRRRYFFFSHSRALKRTIEQGGVLLAVVERADDGVVVERHFGHLEFGIDHHLEEYLKKKQKKMKQMT